MQVLGITGGIGSGKSIVAKIFKSIGIPVYNADLEAKKISFSSQVIRKKLFDRFGSDIYVSNNLNKELLASIVFNHKQHLTFVSSIIHPEVLNDFFRWKNKYLKMAFVGVETAILFESNFSRYVDISINVFASKKIRIQRLQNLKKWDTQSILLRMKNQLSSREYMWKANFTIMNNSYQALLPQIEKLLNFLQKNN